jgi:hypothetical protein
MSKKEGRVDLGSDSFYAEVFSLTRPEFEKEVREMVKTGELKNLIREVMAQVFFTHIQDEIIPKLKDEFKLADFIKRKHIKRIEEAARVYFERKLSSAIAHLLNPDYNEDDD